MTDEFRLDDVRFMEKALILARNGEGRVSPNPPVGCVLAKNGKAVGQGWHDRLGGLHAEAAAIADAGDEAKGATCYVTLSPCCSTGRQPPCSDALIRAGVAEVVVAAEDPNPANSAGIQALRRAGIPVRVGLLREEAEYLARGFFKLVRRRLPYVTLKYAMTLDGKIASASGDSRWVSGGESRDLVQDMRSRSDAILVGAETALADNPLLNVRDPVLALRGGPDVHPQPMRVVADSRTRLPAHAAMLCPENGPGGPVVVAAIKEAPRRRVMELADAGAEVIQFPASSTGHVPLRDLLRELADRGVATVLCEGGAHVASAWLAEHLVDEIVAFVAPKILGGGHALGAIADLGLERMADAVPLRIEECMQIGDDIMIRALVGERNPGT